MWEFLESQLARYDSLGDALEANNINPEVLDQNPRFGKDDFKAFSKTGFLGNYLEVTDLTKGVSDLINISPKTAQFQYDTGYLYVTYPNSAYRECILNPDGYEMFVIDLKNSHPDYGLLLQNAYSIFRDGSVVDFMSLNKSNSPYLISARSLSPVVRASTKRVFGGLGVEIYDIDQIPLSELVFHESIHLIRAVDNELKVSDVHEPIKSPSAKEAQYYHVFERALRMCLVISVAYGLIELNALPLLIPVLVEGTLYLMSRRTDNPIGKVHHYTIAEEVSTDVAFEALVDFLEKQGYPINRSCINMDDDDRLSKIINYQPIIWSLIDIMREAGSMYMEGFSRLRADAGKP